MIFEKAVYDDIGQLNELRIAYLLEDTGDLKEKDLAVIKRDLPDYFERNLNKNIFCYVARKECEIVACAFLLVVEKPMSPAFITGKTGTVLNVYTKPESRHNGYARKLMNMILSDAINMNLSSIELKATDVGYSLYKSLGFKDEITKYHLMKWINSSLSQCHSHCAALHAHVALARYASAREYDCL
jgi:ribosomal protein S18 acetylase RimI-like enzyme